MFSVSVQNLYKDYRIYNRPFDRLYEAITRRPRHQVFSVLRGISFTVPYRQALGIIGDNGAGKSTLLKILVGTLTPSAGSVEKSGRVAALLELGAGFHPEFTGRQNIHLNASLLGMSKEEIAAREEEIIDFSELKEFIDRPVKNYSSGMYVRLAFSIATTIDPDILVIDEALSVGDMGFQRKCIDRMNQFRGAGKTMIFCSHSMYHVQELCDRVIWLNDGHIKAIGKSREIVSAYEEYCKTRDTTVKNPEKLQGEGHVPRESPDCRILSLWLESEDGKPIEIIEPLADIFLKMEVLILKEGTAPQFGFAMIRQDETPCFAAMTHHDRISCGPYNKGETVAVRLKIKTFPLREGRYRLVGGVAEKGGLLWYEYKILWPVKVADGPGLGMVTFRKDWRIALKSEQEN